MLISFILIYICSSISASLYFKYPSTYDCEVIYHNYEDNDSWLYKLAFKEYFANHDADDYYTTELSDTTYGPYLQCFCDQTSEGWSYEYENPFPNLANTYDTYDICNSYNWETIKQYVFGGSISVIIVVVNTILRLILINLIKWIGEDTHSAQLKSITNGVFVVLFMNTGFLLLLAYANFAEIGGIFAVLF